MSFLSGQAVVGQGGVRYGDLQRSDVKSCHIVLSASLVLVVDDVFPDVVLGSGVFDLSLPPPVVHNEHQDQHWGENVISRSEITRATSETCIPSTSQNTNNNRKL